MVSFIIDTREFCAFILLIWKEVSCQHPQEESGFPAVRVDSLCPALDVFLLVPAAPGLCCSYLIVFRLESRLSSSERDKATWDEAACSGHSLPGQTSGWGVLGWGQGKPHSYQLAAFHPEKQHPQVSAEQKGSTDPPGRGQRGLQEGKRPLAF